MLQFRIRSLFGLILVAAIFLGIAQTAGYVVAAGIFVAISVLVWTVFCHRCGAFIYIRIGSAVFALIAIWFLAVDWLWFVADCPDYHYGRDISQYRALGIPVHTQVRDCPTISQLILDDLGVPCEHRKCQPWHKHRFWGFVFPACPRIDGTVRLTDNPDDYTDEFAANVRQLGADNP